MNVAVNKVIKVYFNEAVKFGTNPWIELLTSNGTPVPFTRTISGGNVLSIAATSLFASNTMYRVILHSNSITDLDGAGLVGPWSTIRNRPRPNSNKFKSNLQCNERSSGQSDESLLQPIR